MHLLVRDKKDLLEKLRCKIIDEVEEIAIALLATDGTILSWNAGASKIIGYNESEIVGQNFRELYLPKDRKARLPEQMILLAKMEGRSQNTGKGLKKNDATYWRSVHITAIHDVDRKIIGFTMLTRELGN